MFSTGQYVTDAHTGKVVKIIGVQTVFGMTTYQVYDAVDIGQRGRGTDHPPCGRK